MKCWKCGAENPEDSIYCWKCGVKLSNRRVNLKVKTKQTVPQISQTIPSPGMCFYHPNIPSRFVCAKCGRNICQNCTEKIGGIVFCVTCAPLREKVEQLTFTGALMILVGSLTAFFVLRMVYHEYFGIWTLYDIIFSLAFVICGWQLLRKKKWAAIGGILCSLTDLVVISYFDIYPFIRWGPIFDPLWVLVFIPTLGIGLYHMDTGNDDYYLHCTQLVKSEVI